LHGRTPTDGSLCYLAARCYLAIHVALEFQSDTPKIAAKRNDFEPPHISREIGGQASFAERLNFINPVQISCHAEAHRMRDAQNMRVSVSISFAMRAAS
jgi:hypothetical protein